MASAGKDRVRPSGSGVSVEPLEGRQLFAGTLDAVPSTGDASSEGLLAATLNSLSAIAEAAALPGKFVVPGVTIPPPAGDVIAFTDSFPTPSISSDGLTFDEPVGGGMSLIRTLTIRNTGPTSLTIPTNELTITGRHAALFQILLAPAPPATIPPGGSLDVSLVFTPGTGDILGLKR